MFKESLQNNFPTVCLILTALLLFILNFSHVLNNPFFAGDSAYRLGHADKFIVNIGNHVWLPFLQMHIWVLYKCGAPFWAFKLIPAFYSFIATLFLGLLTYRILRKAPGGLLFSLLLMVCFSFQPVIKALSLNLFQEIIEAAFLYILLYGGMLNLEKKWSLLIIATLGLLTRDTFFLYLSALTGLNFRKIISDRQYLCSFLWLWSIPLIWLCFYLFILGHFSSWPWMVNINTEATKVHFISLSSLSYALQSSGVYIFAFALGLTALVIALLSWRNKDVGSKQGRFEHDYMIFSISSLVIIYALIIMFDPWQVTFGNRRMVMPLLVNMFVWVGILYKKVDDCPIKFRNSLRMILIVGLILMGVGEFEGKGHGWYNQKLHFYNSMQELNKKYHPNDKPTVCIVMGKTYGDIIDGEFIASTLYMNRKYISPDDANSYKQYNCDILIASSQFIINDPHFFKYDTLKVYREASPFVDGFMEPLKLREPAPRQATLNWYQNPFTIYQRGEPVHVSK